MVDVVERITKGAKIGLDCIQIRDEEVPEAVRFLRYELEASRTAGEADLHLCEKRLRAGLMTFNGVRLRVTPEP